MSESAKKKKILLVDDNHHLMVTVSDFLTYEEFEVTEARSGEEALKKLEKDTPDLIVLDISMPGMGGVGFLKHISDAGGQPRYPVLIFTARAAMESFFGSTHVDGFLAKPCSETELLAKIREILDRKERMAQDQQRRTMTVLLGENDPTIREDIVEALEAAGYQVDTVATGPEVLDRATALQPRIMLLKRILPKMNGDIVAALAKAMPSIRQIPIVLYDATQTNEDIMRFPFRVPEGADKFLVTANPQLMLKAVNELVGMKD